MSRGGKRISKQAPLRTCLGCSTVRTQAELVRARLCDGQVTITRASGGRSAYFCPARDCAKKAARHLARALRTEPGTVREVDLWRLFEQCAPIDRPQVKL